MMAADYRHIGGRENRLGRHYSRFSPFLPAPALASQSLALRKLCDAGSNRRRRANAEKFRNIVAIAAAVRFHERLIDAGKRLGEPPQTGQSFGQRAQEFGMRYC